MASDVLPFGLTAAGAQKILREVCKDSARVFFSEHAEAQMVKRRITRTQVIRCLSRGNIVDGPYQSIKGNWKVDVETLAAGSAVHVAAALDKDEKGDYVVVITAYYA